jgi:beta-phosphoglucomutase-like phosphatase (HAD superfamily)
LFDLDGVLTKTAKVHAAWKERFDGYLQERVTRTGERFRPSTRSPSTPPRQWGESRCLSATTR